MTPLKDENGEKKGKKMNVTRDINISRAFPAEK